MKKAQLMVSALLLVSLLLACAQVAAPAPQAPAPQVPTPAAPKPLLKEAWQQKWESMVQGAKKEGKVVIYSASSADIRAAFQRGFKDRFGVSAEFITGQSPELAPKVQAERRAGLRFSDLLMGSGTSVITVLKPAGLVEPIEVGEVLILPEFTDTKLWLGGKLPWQDAAHMSLTYCRAESQIVARNTELVKEGEIQSYNDLLNPKWKGKILIMDPTKAGANLKAVAIPGRYTMGWDWVRGLAKQEPLIMNDPHLQIEWMARGKYPLSYGFKSMELYVFKKAGLPVDAIKTREGGYLTAGTGNISLLKEAPNPNAARLFLNWLLTSEGQMVFSRASGWPAIRLDVSDEGLMYSRPAPDSKTPDADTEEAILKQNEDVRIVKEIFLPLFAK